MFQLQNVDMGYIKIVLWLNNYLGDWQSQSQNQKFTRMTK